MRECPAITPFKMVFSSNEVNALVVKYKHMHHKKQLIRISWLVCAACVHMPCANLRKNLGMGAYIKPTLLTGILCCMMRHRSSVFTRSASAHNAAHAHNTQTNKHTHTYALIQTHVHTHQPTLLTGMLCCMMRHRSSVFTRSASAPNAAHALSSFSFALSFLLSSNGRRKTMLVLFCCCCIIHIRT